ncbi:hypothetical protein ACTJIL_11920 [Luteimonas sp. 22616]
MDATENGAEEYCSLEIAGHASLPLEMNAGDRNGMHDLLEP